MIKQTYVLSFNVISQVTYCADVSLWILRNLEKHLFYEMYEIEMYEIDRFIVSCEYEYSRICVASVVRAKSLFNSETHVHVVVLIVRVVFVCLVFWYV